MKQTKLKRLIIERQIIQRKMADDIGMEPQRLSEMANGKMKGYRYQPKIADYLEVPLNQLFPD